MVKKNMETYLEHQRYKVMILFVLIGSLNSGSTALGYNLIEIFNTFVNNYYPIPINKIIYLLVTLSAVILMYKRDHWLPFLGKAVLPESLIPLSNNKLKTDRIIKIKVPPNVKVMYWAADKMKDDKQDVFKAYNGYINSGVVKSNKHGIASLPIKTGNGYIVPNGKQIPRHIHYRYVEEDNGMLSRLETVKY